MSNSSLVSYTNISANKNSPRNHKIDTITIHCVVGQLSARTICDMFKDHSAKASCNYAIGKDGEIGLCVEEKDRSWCSSNGENDNRAITIECASDMRHPYAINAKVYNSLIILCADICKRNGIKSLKWRGDKSLIGQVDKQNMTVHRWFANKACPGDYIYERLGQIADAVNEKLGSSSSSSTSEPSTSQDESWSATGTATCGGNGVRVRSTPTDNTSSNIMGKLNKGQRFEVDNKKSGPWVHVKVTGIGIGYMHEDYVVYDNAKTETSKPVTSGWNAIGTAVCTGNGVRVRSTPTASTSSNILGKLYKNNRFEIDGNDVAGWTHIKVHLGDKDVIGYISSQYVKKD